MSLITPEIGLFFWMVVIFGVVFFILAKFGFPIITRMIDKRNDHIQSSLQEAQAARDSLASLAEEQAELLRQTKAEQGRILKETSEMRAQMIDQAKQEAQQEAAKILDHARGEIEREKEAALRDIRSQVSMMSLGIAEKVLRKNLSDEQAQTDYIEQMLSESNGANLS